MTLARTIPVFLVGFLLAFGTLASVAAAQNFNAQTPCPDPNQIRQNGMCITPFVSPGSNDWGPGTTPPAEADAPRNSQEGILKNPLESDDLLELMMTLLQFVVRIAAIFLVLAFVWVGFQFAAAQGNDEALSKARTMFMWTVIGALILLGAELIAGVIIETAGEFTP